MPLLRRVRAAAIGTALLATGCLAMNPLAHADPGQADCAQGGRTLRYLVVFTQGTSSQDAEAQITAACGVTTIYYSQIAVAVATSADPGFGERIGPDRLYSAQAQAYYTDPSAGSRKSDEVPSGPGGVIKPDPATAASNLSAQQWDMSMIKTPQAHKINEGSSRVLVGVLDSGIDPGHPKLAKALDTSASAGCVTGQPDTSQAAWAPTTSSHGTHVAGTIAAADDSNGIAGVAPGVRVASVKVVDDAGYIYPEAAVCGFMWAAQQGMTIANNSYFVDPWVFTCSDSQGQKVIFTAVERAVQYATAHGVLSVAAAGNGAVDLTNPGRDSRSPDNAGAGNQEQRQLSAACLELPAGIPGVVTVSAVGGTGVKARYSSYGLGAVSVTAPGGDPHQSTPAGSRCVLSTVPGGYASSCGTSMAAPHVSGVAALLASTHPNATPKQLAKLLAAQADPVACPADYDLNGTGTQDAYCTGDTTFNSFYGHGMVDALAAVSGGSDSSSATSPPATATAQTSPPSPAPDQRAAASPVNRPSAPQHKGDSTDAATVPVTGATKVSPQPTPTL
ncbi:MAG TPA: S8 family serine peptidase, partial [Pseudonocardiaceae bacterium]